MEPTASSKNPAGRPGSNSSVSQRLLGREAEPAVAVLDVPAGGLRAEPLANVALAGAGSLGELGGGERAGSRQRTVEAEPVSHHDERGIQRATDLIDGAHDELLELCGIQRWVVGDRHVGTPSGRGATKPLRRHHYLQSRYIHVYKSH